jgi:hypothetical protein
MRQEQSARGGRVGCISVSWVTRVGGEVLYGIGQFDWELVIENLSFVM